jgi:hypothetical protein
MVQPNRILDVKCKRCKRAQELEVNVNDLRDWQSGKLIQNAMPYLTANEREMLISGLCEKCYDKLFG